MKALGPKLGKAKVRHVRTKSGRPGNRELEGFHASAREPWSCAGGLSLAPAPLMRQAGITSGFGRVRLAAILAVLTALGVSTVLLANMLKGTPWPDRDLLVRFVDCGGDGPISVTNSGRTVWTKSYGVSFAPAEQVLVVAELYEVNQPMRTLGQGILAGSSKEQQLTVAFARTYKNEAGTPTNYSARIHLNGLALEIPKFTVNKQLSASDESINCLQGCELRRQSCGSFTTLLSCRAVDTKVNRQVWVPGMGRIAGVQWCFVVKMIPVDRLDYLALAPIGGSQGLDGRIIRADLPDEQLSLLGQQYKQSVTAHVAKMAFNND